MKNFVKVFLAFVLSVYLFTPAQSQAAMQVGTYDNALHGNVHMLFGSKQLDSSDWGPVDDQSVFGIGFEMYKRNSPIHLVLDYYVGVDTYSDNVGFKYTSVTDELAFGAKFVLEIDSTSDLAFSFYGGGGLAIISGYFEIEDTWFGGSIDDSDTSLGLWINFGAYMTLARVFNMGLDFRYSTAEVEIFGTDVDAGGEMVSLILGFTF